MAIIGITLVVISLAAVINIKGAQLRKADLEYQVREENLEKLLADEEERTGELEEYKIYVKTKQYAEEVAKEKLGLVNPDEILLKAQWCGDKLLAVTDRGARVISTDGTVLYEARFAETPTAMAIGEGGTLYTACGDSREAAGVTVTAYDATLAAVGTKTVAERVLSLHTEKNRVLILTENTLLLGDAALTEVSDREESGIQQMAPWQNGYYCVTEEGLTHRRL